MNVLKRTLLFVVLIVPVALFSAKYEAVLFNGKRYHKGDIVKIGFGTFALLSKPEIIGEMLNQLCNAKGTNFP